MDQLQNSFLNDLALVFSGACEYGQLNQSQEKEKGLPAWGLEGNNLSIPVDLEGLKRGQVPFQLLQVDMVLTIRGRNNQKTVREFRLR